MAERAARGERGKEGLSAAARKCADVSGRPAVAFPGRCCPPPFDSLCARIFLPHHSPPLASPDWLPRITSPAPKLPEG